MLLAVPLAVLSLLVFQNSENSCSQHFCECFRKCVYGFGARMGKAILFPTAPLNSIFKATSRYGTKTRDCVQVPLQGRRHYSTFSSFKKKQNKSTKQGVGQKSCAVITLQPLVQCKPAWIPLCSSVLCPCISAVISCSQIPVPASTAAS